MADALPLPTVAMRQAGAFSRQQAHEAGWSNRRLQTAVARGVLVRRHPEVFVLAGPRTPGTEDWAAALAGGPDAVLSGFSAARLHRFSWPAHAHARACVRVGVDHHLRVTNVVVVRWLLPDADVLDAAPRRTTAGRTVVDCLRLAPRPLRERMLDTALLRGWISVDELAYRVETMRGQRGVASLRSLLRGVEAGARSRAERLAQQVIAQTGLSGWAWNLPVRLLDGSTAVLDAALPHLKIAVEIDGLAHYVEPDRFQRDRTRQNGLVALGWIVLRFTWWDLRHRRADVVAAILRAVALRASEG